MKDNHTIKEKTTSDEHDLNCMKERLTRCLQLLKINHDSPITKTAFKLMQNDQVKNTQHGNWITALNAIAGSCVLTQWVLSQSEVYDFLTVAVSTSMETRTKASDTVIFRIYRDIMTNYESSDYKLKIVYPKIIVDVVAILAKGFDMSGKKVPAYNVEGYYQMRKSDVISTTITEAAKAMEPINISATSFTSATASSIESINSKEARIKSKPPISNDLREQHLNKEQASELVGSLNKITNRSKKDIQASIANLPRTDIFRLTDLCKNYNKLQKYSELITDADHQKLKTALENDIGMKLSSFQLQHAANSIRKAKLYLENVLDRNFIPHGSYGINHTKHNLEYGYLVVGLMEPSRKRMTTTTTIAKERIG
jgi:hypothetical protein